MKKISRERGFMQIVLLAVVVIAALAYFNVDLHTVSQNPIFQKVSGIFVVAYTSYVHPLGIYLWTNISGLFAK